MLVLLLVALWFILQGNLFYVLPCFTLFLCFSVLLALQLHVPRLGKRELILVIFVHLFDLHLFGFVCFLSSWCLGKAAVCDCGTPWTFLLPFFCNAVMPTDFILIFYHQHTELISKYSYTLIKSLTHGLLEQNYK